MMTAVLALVTLVIGSVSATETITYEAFALQPDGSRTTFAKGTREYAPARDIQVEEARSQGRIVFWSKSLSLFDAFVLDAHVTREKPPLTGFGLSLKQRDNPNGFSWEWFDLERGDVFVKRQGPGRVKVVLARGPGFEELAAVEFLDDITLRFQRDMFRGEPGEETHEIVIGKGSVLRVAP